MTERASPQLENGYFRIANEIAEALARTKLSANQSRVLWAILRKTYGWNKKQDSVPISQLSEMTGIRRGHISRTLKELRERNIVTRMGTKTALNKQYTQWRELPSGVHPYRNVPNGVQKRTQMGGLKRHLSKDNTSRSDSPPAKSKRRKISFTDDDMRLARLLGVLMTENNPSRKPTPEDGYKKWADVVRLMRERDNRTPEDIEKVLRWGQSDPFWSGNILSMDKFRKQYDQLSLRMMSEHWRGKESYENENRPEYQVL